MDKNQLTHLLDLFQLESDFTSEELKIAYRDLVQVWHPDKYQQNDRLKQRAQDKIIEINEANTILRDYLASKSHAKPKRNIPQSSPPPRGQVGAFLKNIFHPTDFSTTSDVAFAHALKFALLSKANLSLMHVSHNEKEHVISEFPKIHDTLKSWGAIDQDGGESDIVNLGIRCKKVVGVHESASKSILNYLSKHPADLTVLATSQRQGADRLLKKSIAEDVSRGSGGMTLFIPSSTKGFISNKNGSVNLKRVLIPVSTKPNPLLSVNAASKIASLLDCQDCLFTLVFIGDPSNIPLLNIEPKAGWEWKMTVRRGNVVDMILKVADEILPDLIVMATKGHQGFLDAVRGNTTEQVLRQVPVPLLAVPAYKTKK